MAEGERSLKRQLEYQKRVNSITNKIHSARDTNDILMNLKEEILSLFDADRITVYVRDISKKEIVSMLKSGAEVNEIRVPINTESIAGYCAFSKRVVNVSDVRNIKELRGISPELKFDRSWDQKTGYITIQVLAAPIIYNERLLGVLQLINKKDGDRFTKDDESSALYIAKVLGIAFFKNQRAAQKSRPTRFDFLMTNNIISSNDLAEAMSRARKAEKTVESVLMADFQVSKEDIGRSLSRYYKSPFVSFHKDMPIPRNLTKGLKISYLKNNVFVPVSQSGDTVIIAMEDPNYLPARDAIKRLFPAARFEYCVSLREDIYEMIAHFFDVRDIKKLKGPGSIEDILGKLESDYEEEEEKAWDVAEDDSAIVQLVNKMIVDAYDRRASDIHFEPGQGKADALIRFRIDGACQPYQTLLHTYKRAVVSRLKIMSDLDISERRLPQDGKIKFKKFAPLDIELRVATIPTAGQNEDVVMRILPSGDPVPLERLGMSERNYNAFEEIIKKPYGMILVVGPTGSGKTTTLHSALKHINRPETKIWTAEDPVEITQDGLRQVQVLPKIGLSFATAMRSFLRADPDVIMVGEMRDQETASTGIEASLTGHLVFSTLHTNSAPETITRLLDMGMDPFNFADALLGILAQRLARALCEDCKAEYHPSRKEFDYLVRAYDGDFNALGLEYNSDLCLYKAKGCPRCTNMGYRGRTGIHELLLATDRMKLLMQNRARTEELRQQAIKDGMTTLMQDGIRKVFLGITDLEQVRKVCIR